MLLYYQTVHTHDQEIKCMNDRNT